MKEQFWMYRRANGIFYCEDTETGQQESLKTRDCQVAKTLLHARNEAARQPLLNRQMARAYLSASDPLISTRTWAEVFSALIDTKKGETGLRWFRAAKDSAFDPIRSLPVVETRAEHFLKVLKKGSVSTNVYLRRIHNFALDMGWLPWPVLVKRLWPKVVYKDKRAITAEEHRKIIERERNPERRDFYEMAWHIGAAQSDVAWLKAEDIEWKTRVITFNRKKNGALARISFGEHAEKILRNRPTSGFLFPYLQKIDCKDRATEFKQRCDGLKIEGVSLHSYRYSWAERALASGLPERFAMCSLGHSSKAIHQSYARHSPVVIPALEDFEKVAAQKVIPLHGDTAVDPTRTERVEVSQ